MNKLLHAVIFSALFLAVYSQEAPQLLNEINDPNQIIHSLNETSIDTSLLDQVKNLNAAKEDPADVVDDIPATDGTLIDNLDDFKTTDYVDSEPLVHSGEDDEIQQYDSHIATVSGEDDDIQIFRSSIKFGPEAGEDDQVTQIYESSVKFAPEGGEDDGIQLFRSSIKSASENGEDDDIQIFSSSIKFAPEEGEENDVQIYQSPIAVAPKEDEAEIGTPVDNVDDFRTIDYTEEKDTPEHLIGGIAFAPEEDFGEYTQGQLVENLDDFRTIDTLQANDPEVVNNAEEKLEDEAEATPGFAVPPTVHDRSDEEEETSTGELDDKKYDTIDVQEKGFLPSN